MSLLKQIMLLGKLSIYKVSVEMNAFTLLFCYAIRYLHFYYLPPSNKVLRAKRGLLPDSWSSFLCKPEGYCSKGIATKPEYKKQLLTAKMSLRATVLNSPKTQGD